MPPGPPTAKRLAIVADYAVQTGRVIVHSRLLRPERPDRLLRGLRQVSRYGPTPAAGFVSASIRFPDRDAIIDEAGTLSFGEVNRRTDALTNALAARGVRSGDGVAIMCRNHRGFVEAQLPVRSSAPPPCI